MTDTVEQAARVLAVYWKHNHTNESLGRQRMLAQALADAGLLAEPARTVPTRGEIAEVLTYALTGAGVDDYREYSGEEGLRAYYRMADAVLELLADQPTVAEVKAQALEEAADLTDNPHEDHWLRERARQIRDGK